ncbi:hypothetical protein acdb102_15040 [Acidothermaceae bacterium B102]|nr:hypothetical protein acdb102_15040 [Acidothermaceae bacterium B102]
MTAGSDTIVGGRYRLTSLIATGGMGAVWRARDERLQREVAVKLLKPELLHVQGASIGSLTRFRAEARHAAALSHPGIAAVYDYGETADQAFLVMELVEGEPLSRLLAREGALPVPVALRIVGLTALALEAAHDAGVIHRDIKPANLIIVEGPGGLDVKVTDFGIARTQDAAPLTRTGMVMGTAHYLSPEQARAGTVTPSSDLYSLGVVGYECLTGHRPFEGATAYAIAAAHAHQPPPPLPDTIPPAVRELIGRALAKNPADRPASAGDFGRTALALAAGPYPPHLPVTAPRPVPAPPTAVLPAVAVAPAARPAPPPPLSRRRHRRRLWWIVVVAALVGAAAAVALIETDAAKAAAVSVQDNRSAGPSVYPEPATRPQRLGLDPAAYATDAHQRRVP